MNRIRVPAQKQIPAPSYSENRKTFTSLAFIGCLLGTSPTTISVIIAIVL
jgi:hypothetical protein